MFFYYYVADFLFTKKRKRGEPRRENSRLALKLRFVAARTECYGKLTPICTLIKRATKTHKTLVVATKTPYTFLVATKTSKTFVAATKTHKTFVVVTKTHNISP